MIKLLRANFARLRKSKSFWICTVLAFAFNILSNIEVTDSWTYQTGQTVLSSGSKIMLFSSVFTALYLGTDYACGTIRNKLAVGHSRAKVYFSSLVTVITGSLLMLALCSAPPIFKSVVWGKELGMPIGEFILDILILVCAMIAMSAIFTLLGMLITEKALTTTITIVLSIVLLIGSAVLLEFLNQPKEVTYAEVTADGGTPETLTEPNPMYIGEGLKRDIMTAITDVLPSGQIMRLEANQRQNYPLHNPELYPLYSLGAIVVITAAGIVIFRRKDLK